MAFRNDYCLARGEERRAVQVRTFDVGHIFWIPILPAGFWKRWVCTVCGKDRLNVGTLERLNVQTSKTKKRSSRIATGRAVGRYYCVVLIELIYSAA